MSQLASTFFNQSATATDTAKNFVNQRIQEAQSQLIADAKEKVQQHLEQIQQIGGAAAAGGMGIHRTYETAVGAVKRYKNYVAKGDKIKAQAEAANSPLPSGGNLKDNENNMSDFESRLNRLRQGADNEANKVSDTTAEIQDKVISDTKVGATPDDFPDVPGAVGEEFRPEDAELGTKTLSSEVFVRPPNPDITITEEVPEPPGEAPSLNIGDPYDKVVGRAAPEETAFGGKGAVGEQDLLSLDTTSLTAGTLGKEVGIGQQGLAPRIVATTQEGNIERGAQAFSGVSPSEPTTLARQAGMKIEGAADTIAGGLSKVSDVGALGSQIAGQAIGGKTGSVVSDVGTGIQGVKGAASIGGKIASIVGEGAGETAGEIAGTALSFLGPVGEVAGAGIMLYGVLHDIFGKKKNTQEDVSPQSVVGGAVNSVALDQASAQRASGAVEGQTIV